MADFAVTDDVSKARERTIFAVRIVTAIVQAIALCLLADAAEKPPAWPATDALVFTPLHLLSLYLPAIMLFGVGQIRARSLTIWAVVAALVIVGLGYHDAARGHIPDYPGMMTPQFWPGARIALALSASLFIAHTIIVDSIVERRLPPPYPRHFDTAWKQGVQAILAVFFVGIFWGVLELGAQLFRLVDLFFFQRLIDHRWFAYPATTLAFAVSIHVTDVQPALIRGARSVSLTLFSWLLPLLTAIMLGFLGSLPFISLTPLWRTHSATAVLLTASGILVFLMNCCYQDGAAEQTRSKIKRVATMAAAFELLPLVGLAAWALSLRVGQYGWTVQRITGAAVIVVAACYAFGYAFSAVRSSAWMKRIELTNFVTAYVVVATILALFSPVADPARLMVADQMARLKSGTVRPEMFDFAALKYDGARWGAVALADLSQIKDVPDAETINKKAAAAISSQNRFAAQHPSVPPTPAEASARVQVYPAGRVLPASFFDGSLLSMNPVGGEPFCFRPAFPKCIARFLALEPGTAEAILFIDQLQSAVFEQDAGGVWRKVATVTGLTTCEAVRQGLAHDGPVVEPHVWPDLVVGGQRLLIAPAAVPCQRVPR